jgi:hypothetical protein
MNLLGHEIDISFVYKISPLQFERSRSDAFWMFFELSFKDGRSHKVEINYNFILENVKGKDYVFNIKTLNKRELACVEKKWNKSLVIIKKLREVAINKKNNESINCL